jgi:photosystem II stability/assembly factor-like uncharacterized protein
VTNAPGAVIYWDSVLATWEENSIAGINAAHDPCSIALLGDWILVFSTDSGSMFYALEDEVIDDTSNWFETSTGFTTAPTCSWGVGTMVWVGGEFGYVYKVHNPQDGAIVLEAGTLDSGHVYDIHALDERNALAVGPNGMVLYTSNQVSWKKTGGPVGIGVDLETCWMIDEETWFVGDSQGKLWYTLNHGQTWTMKKDFA